MIPTRSRPKPIGAYEKDTFAFFTVQRRIPKILSGVTSELGEPYGRDPRWHELRTAIVGGGPIDLDLFSASTKFWRDRLDHLRGATWADQPFFDLELLFYRAVSSIAGDLRPGFDVFASARRAALGGALPAVAAALEPGDDVDLSLALLWSLTGNEADLSQLRSGAPPGRMVADQRAALIGRLGSASRGARVVILADNAGSELCFDLVLIDRLLAEPSRTVELHVKPEPMFVSDAVVSDVDETIARFAGARATTGIGRLGRRLRAARARGRLAVVAPADWAEPRHMNALDPELAASLGRAAVVLAKGDLNYRRFFEDRAWPADTPVREASVAQGMCAFALRVLKSDCVVGLPSSEVARLHAEDADWRSNGTSSMVQRVDRGPPPIRHPWPVQLPERTGKA